MDILILILAVLMLLIDIPLIFFSICEWWFL